MNRMLSSLLFMVMVCTPVFPAEKELSEAEQLCVKGFEFFEKDMKPEARALAEEAIALDPECGRAYFLKAMLLSKRARFAQAIESFKKATRIEPEKADWHREFGYAYMRNFQFKEAQDRLKISFELNHRDPEVFIQLSQVFFRLKNYETAWWYVKYGKRAKAVFDPRAIEAIASGMPKPKKFPKRKKGVSVDFSPKVAAGSGENIPAEFIMKETDKTTAFPNARELISSILKMDKETQKNGIWLVATYPEGYDHNKDKMTGKLEKLAKKNEMPFFICRGKNLPDGWFRTH